MPEIAKSKKGHSPAGLSGHDRLYLLARLPVTTLRAVFCRDCAG